MSKLNPQEILEMWNTYLENEVLEEETFVKIKNKKPKDLIKTDKKRDRDYKNYRSHKEPGS